MVRDILSFCRLFYETNAIPVSLYTQEGARRVSFPDYIGNLTELPLLKGFLEESRLSGVAYNYAHVGSSIYIGVLKLTASGETVVLGPVFDSTLSNPIVRQLENELRLSEQQRLEFESYIYAAHRFSARHLIKALGLVNLCLNDDETPLDSLHNNPAIIPAAISSEHAETMYTLREEEQHRHHSFRNELITLDYVRNGEIEKLLYLAKTTRFTYTEGVVADNVLRQKKNILISVVTLYTRSAIAGGLDEEEAYTLSDIYISKSEKLTKTTEIEQLMVDALLDFTQRVADVKTLKGLSPDVARCVQFIRLHVNEAIRNDDVAAYVGKSASYLSKKMRKELDADMSSYIMQCKLEEAKRLLAYTDKSLSDISSYLCFSSQSYFQNVFKKAFGLTPMQYRRQKLQR